MTDYPLILVDTSLLVAYYDAGDEYHTQVRNRKQPFERVFRLN